MEKININKKSPLKDSPLHVAGQSIDEQIKDYMYNEASPLFYLIAFLFITIALIWLTWFLKIIYLPLVISIIAAAGVIYSVIRLSILKIRIKNLVLARNGERIVAEVLDNLRNKGYIVFHDIIDKNFNIDHAVLTPNGIFTIETKTYSKPPKGEIILKDENIIIGSMNTGKKIIMQAESQAKWLHSMLSESTGISYHIMPVVVFPGWFVNPMPESLKKKVWVLNPEALSSFIENEPIRLKDNDMHMAAFHLSRYIRIFG